VGLFFLGWLFQFLGHAFEGKPPEFFKDWRFLFVGLQWWLKTVARVGEAEPVANRLRTGSEPAQNPGADGIGMSGAPSLEGYAPS